MGKPTIRFEGYTDDWEQRKLNEIADKVSEKNKNNEFSEPFTNSAEQGIIRQKDYFDREIVNNENLNGYYIVRNDDFIYNPRISATAPVGPINRNRLGRNGVMSPLYTVFRTHDIDNLYLEFYFKTTKWHRFMKLNGDSGARFDRFTISSTQFMEMPIPYPTLEEQQKIGEYFESLDTLITLHQRKCEETKKLKKFMLQKMFPKKGEKVPEIRFGGFTDDWEQRKFGEIVEKYEDPVETPTEGYTRLGIRSHAKGTFHGYVEKGKELETAKMFRVAADKFIVNITFGWEHAVAITDENDAGKLVSHRFPQYSFNAGMEPKFFRYLILDENFKHHLELSSPGGAGRNRVLKLSDMLQYKMNFPSEAEQKKIAAYFDDLDHLITLHHRKYINGKKEELLAWEQRKLGDDLGSIHTGTNLLGSTTNIGMPLIKMGNIQRGYFDTSKVEFLAENEQPDNEDIANYGDFFFNTRNTLELVGKGATWMKNSGEYAFNSNIARFELRNIDTIFFNYLYNTETMTRQIHARAMGTTSVAAIYPRTLESVGYLVPCMKEQQKIGAYFKHLDHLITLHQHKCEELQNIKKFMLQNIFI